MLLKSLLSNFQPISLNNASSVSLLNRIDRKFVFKKHRLYSLLEILVNYYDILDVDGVKLQDYKSLYFDTEDRFFFMQHHNSRVNRNKVRFREYVDSGIIFLEVKFKNNKGKTIKSRLRVNKISDFLSPEQKNYVNSVVGNEICLESKQWINFKRITFVDKSKKERLTIDLDLTFYNKNKSGSLQDLVIAEVKTDKSSNGSKFIRIAKECGVYPFRFSKYCLSTVYLDQSVKRNRFKEKLIMLNKLK